MSLEIRVKELREARGWSQAELARRARIRPNTLGIIEKGKAKRIDLDALERLADALDVAPGYLIVKLRRR